MQFTAKHFPPPGVGVALSGAESAGSHVCSFTPEAEPPSTYVYDRALVLALNVAMATGRPLLLAGEPGCGKTTLARNVALAKGWANYRSTVHSRTQAADLLWDVDTLSRLNDANDTSRSLWGEERYVEPGMLWWALAPKSARRRGLPEAIDHPPAEPLGHRDTGGAVLLIDEIDKAEPDVPNDLLEVLDTRSFSVKGRTVRAERDAFLMIITTNLERELPGAFMRRCIVHRFAEPKAGWFVGIAAQQAAVSDLALAATVEARLFLHREEARRRGNRLPGTAEYLDALTALADLQVQDSSTAEGRTAWDHVERCVFGKQVATGSP